MKKISPKQLQNQFKTWQVKMPSMWQDIEMFAEQYGILTPTGKVSLRRRNKANLDAFLEVYQKKFGSFTSYEKKIKEEYKRAKENGMTNATNYKEYQQEKSDWAEVRDKFFKVFVSDLKMDYDVVNEEYCENVYEGLLAAEREGLVRIYRYPNKPAGLKQDGSDILDKWRRYKYKMNKEFSKNEFDRLVYLHPNLLPKINELAQEFNYDYHYEPNDLIELFSSRIQRQLYDVEHEQYIDCSYISICSAFPNLKSQIDVLYDEYKNSIIQEDSIKKR